MDTRSNSTKKRSALGRGLRSLIPVSGGVEEEVLTDSDSSLQYLEVDDLVAGENQPRTNFEQKALQELSDSIAKHGVLQPIVVRKREDDEYEIVAGERRWRASKLAGLKTVPCIISGVANKDVLTVALVENIQREDLNAIEEAESYRRLSEDVGMTQDQIASAVGKDRATVSNVLRLLKLPESTQRLVVEKRMSMGHARALLGLRDQDVIEKVAMQIAEEGMSVRMVEQLVQGKTEHKTSALSGEGKRFQKVKSPETLEERDARRKMEQVFGTKVEFKHKKGKGTVVIHFSSMEQLSDILERVDVSL